MIKDDLLKVLGMIWGWFYDLGWFFFREKKVSKWTISEAGFRSKISFRNNPFWNCIFTKK